MIVLGVAAAVATVYMAQLLSRYRSRRRGLPDPLAAGVGNNPAMTAADGAAEGSVAGRRRQRRADALAAPAEDAAALQAPETAGIV